MSNDKQELMHIPWLEVDKALAKSCCYDTFHAIVFWFPPLSVYIMKFLPISSVPDSVLGNLRTRSLALSRLPLCALSALFDH